MQMGQLRFYLMSLVLASTVSCRQQDVNSGFDSTLSNSQIINGEPVSKEDPVYARTVRILELSDGVWYPRCTGTILGADLIITAAHCVQYTNIEFLRVGFDVQPLSTQMQRSADTRVDVLTAFNTAIVQELVVHPEYRPDKHDHDMALLKIASTIPEGSEIAPLLPEFQFSQLKPQEYELILAGYGVVTELPEIPSEILRRTQVTGRFEGVHVITDQTKGTGACIGDSGGPAYLRVGEELYLVGVTEGAAGGYEDCKHEGLLGNPSLEIKFLNDAAIQLRSETRF